MFALIITTEVGPVTPKMLYSSTYISSFLRHIQPIPYLANSLVYRIMSVIYPLI